MDNVGRLEKLASVYESWKMEQSQLEEALPGIDVLVVLSWSSKPHAADLIQEGDLPVKYKLRIDDIIDTVHVFPTMSESIRLAAQSFYRDIGSLSFCTE